MKLARMRTSESGGAPVGFSWSGVPGHPQVLVAITTTFTRQFICLLLLINVNSELTHKVLNIKEVICTISPITGADN